MKLLYLSSVPLPSPFANRLQVVKMSEAFAKQSDFVLCLSTLKAPREQVFSEYHITQPFRIRELGSAPRHLRTLLYVFKALKAIREERPDILFVREAPLAFALTWFFPRIAFEVHDFPEQRLFWYRIFLRRMTKIVSTNRWKAEQLVRVFGIPSERILYVPNGVDIAEFANSASKEEARRALALPLDKILVTYCGQLFGWKGGDVLLRAAAHLDAQYEVVFVGGTPSDQARVASAHPMPGNVRILPQQPHRRITEYLCAADVLVLPNTGKEDISRLYTSPIKLFEYMASRRPIVASDLPSIREIVDDQDVAFFAPDDPAELARAVCHTVEDVSLASRRTAHAYQTVQRYTWEERARRVLDFLAAP